MVTCHKQKLSLLIVTPNGCANNVGMWQANIITVLRLRGFTLYAPATG
jgi:hypothetical protein